MVEGYRSPEDVEAERKRKGHETRAAAASVAADTAARLSAAADQLRASGAPPDCMVELMRKALFRRRRPRPVTPGWFLGGYWSTENSFDGSVNHRVALGADGSFYLVRGHRVALIKQRKAFLADEAMRPRLVWNHGPELLRLVESRLARGKPSFL